MIRELREVPDLSPMWDKSWVTWSLYTTSPLSLMVAWFVRPRGANRALGSFEMWLCINGIVQHLFTSASIFLVRMGSRSSLADLWLPLEMVPCKSPSLSCSDISSRGKDDPLFRISFILSQCGCFAKIGSKSEESLNSDPYYIGEKADDRMILSKSMPLSQRTLKFSLAAASVRLKLKGGAEGMRAGATMAPAILFVSFV